MANSTGQNKHVKLLWVCFTAFFFFFLKVLQQSYSSDSPAYKRVRDLSLQGYLFDIAMCV